MLFDEVSERNFRALVEALRNGGVTAFVGAGLSATHYPTWPALHERLQSEAKIAPARVFRSESAPVDFMAFRNALGSARYLELIKEIFGGPVVDIPRAYRLIDATSGLNTIITTNLDECLAATAASNESRPRVVVYPNLQVGQRYVYLHGRASTASDANELVLCDDDYDYAYDPSGSALTVLQGYMLGEVVFLGYSMSDPDPMNVVNRVLRWRRRPGPNPTTIRPNPFVVRAAKLPSDSTESLEAYVAAESSRMNDRGLRPIWYPADETHSQLTVLLEQLQYDATPALREPVFLQTAGELDQLLARTALSDDEAARLVELIRTSSALARHFFINATSATLYETMRDAGLVTAVAEPEQLPDGLYRSLPWAAAPFLRRIAAQRPDAVVETTLSMRATENWAARNSLAELAVELPVDRLHDVLPTLFSWIKGRFASVSLVTTSLSHLLARLSSDAEYGAALEVLAQLIEPRDDRGSGTDELTLKDYELEQIGASAEKLANQRPSDTYAVFKQKLMKLLEKPEASYMIWRPAIEEHPQNAGHFHQGANFLVGGARDSLEAWARSNAADAIAEIRGLLDSEYDLLRRLGIHTLIVVPALLAEIQLARLIESCFFRPSLFHEIARLINLRFGEFTEEGRRLVHELVLTGPPLRDGESTDSHEQRVDSWRRSYLAVLPDEYQTEQERSWSSQLTHDWGEPDERFFLVYSRSGWVASQREPGQLPDAEVDGIDAVSDALQRDPSLWNSTREYVAKAPDVMLELLPRIRSEDMPHVYPFIDAYIELCKAGRAFDWTPLVDAAERLAEEDESGDSTFAWLLRQGLGTRKAGVPDDLLDRAAAVCERVLARHATLIETGIDAERESSFHQLNHPAGQAADALMFYLWRKGLADGEARSIPPQLQTLLDRASSEGWGGFEFRYAVGRSLSILEWIEPGWLGRNIDRFAPGEDSPAAHNAKRAFLNGHLIEKRPTPEILRQLRPLYREALADTASDERIYLDRREHWSVNSLVELIYVGWIWDVDGFAEDGLMGEFLRIGSDNARAHAVWFLHADWTSADEAKRQAQWPRLDDYWKARSRAWRNANLKEKSEELTAFTRWLGDVAEPLDRLEERLTVMIDHLTMGFGMELIADFMIRHVEASPLVATRILERMVDRWSGDPEFYWSGRKLEPLLDAVIQHVGKSDDGVRRIVNRLFEIGFADFRSKIA